MATFRSVDITHPRSLTSQLRAHATDKAAKGPLRASRSIHASSYYGCSLKQVYGLLGYTPSDPNYVWSWDLAAKHGDAVHALIQESFLDSGKVVTLPNGKPAIEVTLGPDVLPKEVAEEFASYKIGCRIDAVLNGLEGMQIPIEIKTIDAKYLTGSSQKYLPDRLADYEMQTQLILHFYRNTLTGERCKYALIYLVNRGDISQRFEYLVEYDALLMEAELERIANIRDHWLQAKLPKPEPERGCTFCQFKTICPAPDSQKK